MLKPEIKSLHYRHRREISETGGQGLCAGGMFVPNEQVWLLNTAIVDGAKWHRVKRATGESVWVIDHYLFAPLRQ